MTEIALNARFYAHPTTGMQRYGIELNRRLSHWIQPLRPTRALRGVAGHLWEQFYLPPQVGNRLLFSPNNTGPLAVGRQVCTIHDLIPLDHPEWFNWRFVCWYQWLLPRLVNKVRHIIAVSHFTKNRIVARLDAKPEKITVIHNGIDERFSPRNSEEAGAVRAALGIKSPEYVLYVGSLEPRKNLRRLLEAWAKVPDSVAGDVVLVVAGARGSSRVFGQLSLGPVPPRVQFTGYVSDAQLPSLYAGAIALIYPSLYEGFGLPPLEAMACGTPVVTSAGSPICEVVGDSAVFVNPQDVESIALGIARVLSSAGLRRELRERGIERARCITWERTAQRTLEVLLEQAKA